MLDDSSLQHLMGCRLALARRAKRASATMAHALLATPSPAEHKTLAKPLTRLSDTAAGSDTRR